MSYFGDLNRNTVWEYLKNITSEIGNYRTYETDITLPGGSPMVALDDMNRPHLLIPLEEQENRDDRTSKGVHLVSRPVKYNGESYNVLDLVCRDGEFADVFSDLVVSLLKRFDNKAEELNYFDICSTELERWRDLFRKSHSAKLGEDALAGLFGELYYLKKILQYREASLSCWMGPEGNRHDFHGEDVTLEVKTTRSRDGSIKINGLTQLEPSAERSLYLGLLHLEKTSGQGKSVPELIDELREFPIDLAKFNGLLSKLGFHAGQQDKHEETKFSIKNEHIFMVSDTFPKLTSESFLNGTKPEGVSNISYEITPTEHLEYEIDSDTRGKIFSSLASV